MVKFKLAMGQHCSSVVIRARTHSLSMGDDHQCHPGKTKSATGHGTHFKLVKDVPVAQIGAA